MKLPNGSRADIGTKLEDYCLNPSHRQGQHKARVFHAMLGITLANAEILRSALREAGANSDEVIDRGNNGFGQIYELGFQLKTEVGSATILSGWIVREGEDFPRLTTCFIL